ncbi:MAG: hypothetical protein NC397_04305 [Clostridium sp.]|nr:hypothetical protein [Clostridium sp.]
MKKTFRKAIASMLAVLMVICAMPFTAFAAEVGRQWWVDDGIEIADITGEPEFEGLLADPDWDWVEFGSGCDMLGESGADCAGVPDLRDNYKPVLGIITTSMGKAGMTPTELATYYNACYGYSATYDYDKMVNDGKLLNPAQLEAGQRIAVSVEMGGIDLVNTMQLVGTFDNKYLMPSRYTRKPAATPATANDPWAEVTNTTQGWLCNGAKYMTDCLTIGNAVCDKSAGTFYIQGTGASAGSGLERASQYIGSNATGERSFGKYGVFMGTMVFEVLKDCDLSDVFHITEHNLANGVEGTYIQPYNTAECEDGIAYIGTASQYDVFAVMPVVWDNYSAGSTSHTHTAAAEKANVKAATCTEAGYTGDVVCADCGEVMEAGSVIKATGHTPAADKVDVKTATCTEAGYTGDVVCKDCGTVITAGTATKALGHDYTGTLTPATDKTHTVACVNDCGTTETQNCKFEVKHTVLPEINKEGLDTYTCACGNSYTEKVDALTCAHTGDKTTTENVTKAATCTAVGSKTITVTCDVCGNVVSETTEEIPMTAHTAADELANVKDATCTAKGYTGDVVCKDCGAVITKGTETDMIDHTAGTPVENVTVAPTCTTVGSKTITTSCTVCGNVIDTKTEEVPMTEHVAADELANVKAATCTAEGYTGDVVCKDCGAVITKGETVPMIAHTPGEAVVEKVDATLTTEGSITTTVNCTVCGTEISKDVEVIPMIAGFDVTVDAQDLGTVTLNGVDVTNGATIKVEAGKEVKLVATATQGAEFLGWIANGATTVSTDAEYTTIAQANITYTPVFAAVEDGAFVVTFVDAYGNIVSTQTVATGADVTVPAVPERAGYVDGAWSLTAEEIAALTADATISAQYTKNEAKLYTVTADTCDITVAGATVANVATDIAYDTQVTVTKEGATAWTIDGVTVAYGDTYTFYVGSDVTVVPTFKENVTATPAVANVKVTRVGNPGAEQFTFLATRSLEGFEFVNAGFIYGAGKLGDVKLADVDQSAIKAVYCKTTSDQFSVTYGLRSQSGEVSARAFLTFIDGNGNTQVIYADTQTVKY